VIFLEGNARAQKYAWVILAVLTIAQVVMSMGAYAWGPLAPFLVAEFQVSRTQIGSLTSALFLFSVLMATPSGFLVDRYGARLMLIICLVAMGIPFAFLSLAKSYMFLMLFAALCGLGYGVINQVSTRGIMFWFNVKTRATAMGIKQSGVSIGGALVAILLPALSLAFRWQMAVVVVGFLMLMMAILSFLFYQEKPVSQTETFASKAAKKPGGELKGSLRQVIAHPDLKILTMLAFLMSWSQTCITSFYVLYLIETFQYSEVVAGSFLTVAMIAGACGRIGWGIVSDRLFKGDRNKPMMILGIVATTGMLGTALVTPGVPGGVIYLFAFFLGISFLGWNAVLMVRVAEIAGAELAASVMGIMSTLAWVGIVIGPPVFGAVADRAGYFWGWLMLTVFGIIGLVSSLYIVWRPPAKISKNMIGG
jgi:sugar phosphate permease